MANIFNSKEVYKRIPKVSSKDNPLRKVRGMYVTGDYRPPYYIDSSLHIMEINTNKPTIKDFTQVTKPEYMESSMSILDVSCNWDLNIKKYTRATATTDCGSTISILGLETNEPTITKVPRPKAYADADVGSSMSILDLNCSGYTFTRYHTQTYDSVPEQLLVVLSISTTNAEIADA